MRFLSAVELLDAWETARAGSALERPLVLLAAATNQSRAELAQLPLGARNEQLLQLRARVFGNVLDALTDCPACGERLELPLRVADFLSPPPPVNTARELRVNGFTLMYRLPDSNDLSAARQAPNVVTARELLLQRVVVNVNSTHHAQDAISLDANVMDALSAQLERDDPLAALRVQLKCPNCLREWDAPFDIEKFFWLELDAWAKRILSEVHALASAYGWSESEILALSPQRRQTYLEMIGG